MHASAACASLSQSRTKLRWCAHLDDPEQRQRLREEADTHYWELQASASLSRNLGTLWYWSRGSYRRRRDTRSLPTSRESTYLPSSRDAAMTRTHAGVAQCYSPAAFIAFIKGAPTGAVAPIGVSCRPSRPTAIAHFADPASSASQEERDRELRITVTSCASRPMHAEICQGRAPCGICVIPLHYSIMH